MADIHSVTPPHRVVARTSNDCPYMPHPSLDWSAVLDSHAGEDSGPIGRGETEPDAMRRLLKVALAYFHVPRQHEIDAIEAWMAYVRHNKLQEHGQEYSVEEKHAFKAGYAAAVAELIEVIR